MEAVSETIERKKIPFLKGFFVSLDESYQIAKDNELYRLGIKVNTPEVCNWACPYCYVGNADLKDRPRLESDRPAGTLAPSKDPNWAANMKGWIDQGIDNGVKAISVNGTLEPTTSPDYLEIIRYCVERGLLVTLVTNGTKLNDQVIRYLFDLDIRIVTKMNVPMVEKTDPRYDTFANIQKYLSGRPGPAENIYEDQKALVESLIRAGFANPDPKGGTRLGVESVVTMSNVDYLAELIGQLRQKNIYSHIEVAKIQGFARNNPKLTLEKDRLWELFEEVRAQDNAMGFADWEPKPPYVAGTCYENLFRLDLHADGKVSPCPGIETALGDLTRSSLSDILQNDKLAIIRDLPNTIQGDCRDCELMQNRQCYGGCRGTVYQTMKSNGFSEYDGLTASDPSCLRVKRVLNDGTMSSIFDTTRNAEVA